MAAKRHLTTRSFSCGLDTERTFKLFRALRLTMLNYVCELWFALMDRRHAPSNVYARALLRIDWTRVQRMLGRTANRRGRLMPDWSTVDGDTQTDVHEQGDTCEVGKSEAS